MFDFTISDRQKAAAAYKICNLVSHDGKMNLWISNVQGEGMEITEKQFFDVIDKFFKEEF